VLRDITIINEIPAQKMEISTSKIAIALVATLSVAVKPFFPEKTGYNQ
jgi:hypothetical protein